MTSAQTMLIWMALGAALTAPLLGGCAGRDRLVAPSEHRAPYDTSRGQPMWAVVPLRNESGTSAADAAAISDAVVGAAAQTKGLRVLPLNRTIEAMRALEMAGPQSPDDLKKLAEALGVDGVIVGSITAYDPYDPVLGLALALYTRPGSLAARTAEPIDTRTLSFQPTDYKYFPQSNFKEAPASVASLHLDGKNQGVQMEVREYAKGRTEAESALGWRRYLKSMGLFTEFSAWVAVGRLLDQETLRLAEPATTTPPH
jgi:hypothetical protein